MTEENTWPSWASASLVINGNGDNSDVLNHMYAGNTANSVFLLGRKMYNHMGNEVTVGATSIMQRSLIPLGGS